MFNGSVAIQAREAREVPRDEGLKPSLLVSLVRRPRWLLGTGLALLALPTQTGALLLAPLTVVQACDAAGLLLLLVLGSRMLGERVGRREIAAVVALVLGIVLLTVSGPHRTVTHVDKSDVAVALGIVGAFAVLPIVLRRAGGLVVVFGAGFAFALTAFCIKLMADALDSHNWVGLVVVLALAGVGALVGTLNEQTALQRRQATQVAPIIFVVELLVPVALAVSVVGESWSGDTAPILVALALVIAGTVALSRAPAVAGMIATEARERELQGS